MSASSRKIKNINFFKVWTIQMLKILPPLTLRHFEDQAKYIFASYDFVFGVENKWQETNCMSTYRRPFHHTEQASVGYCGEHDCRAHNSPVYTTHHPAVALLLSSLTAMRGGKWLLGRIIFSAKLERKTSSLQPMCCLSLIWNV